MDQIDILAGLSPGDELYSIRRQRQEFVLGAEDCRRTVLTPSEDLGIDTPLRLALAARMARTLGRDDLGEIYEGLLEETGSSLQFQAIARNQEAFGDSRIHAMIKHADFVTATPSGSMKEHIERLQDAGLSSSQIIALSELIAFVNYEARIIIGLEALGKIV